MQTNRPTIEEEMLMKRSRSEWEAMKQQIELHLSLGINMNQDIISMYKERIQYIDSVLDRYYVDMCIRCGYKNPKRHYDSVHLNCLNCMKNIIYRVIDEMTDEERADLDERLDKQLESKGE